MAEPSASGARKREYEAFLFIPTIVEPPGGTEAILRKLAAALSGVAPADVGAVELKGADDLVYGPSGTEKAKRWTLQGAAANLPVYDVIEVDYRPDLRLRDQGRAAKLLRVALASWWLAGSLLHAALAIHRKTLWQRLQVAYIAAFTLALGVYLFLLAKVAVEALVHQLAPDAKWVWPWSLPDAAAAGAQWAKVADAWSRGPAALMYCQAFVNSHLQLFGGIVTAGLVVVGIFTIRAARDRMAVAFDNLVCWIACRRIEMTPWHPHARRRLARAVLFFVALVAIAAGAATAPWWEPVLIGVATIGLTLAGFALGWLLGNTNQIVAVMTVLGIPLLAGGGGFGTMMDLVVAGMDYGRIGTLRADITGRLLEVIRAAIREGYTRVHVMAHAFGGIVALDTLFYTTGCRETGALDAAELERVGDLITIAPPITFVQQLFPRHFERISGGFVTPEKHQWINVCSPLDILGTPILDEPFDVLRWQASQNESQWAARVRASMHRAALDADFNPGDPNNIFFGRKRNIDFTGWYPLNLQWFEMISLTATRARDWYWNVDGKADYNAFARIVPLLDTAAFEPRAPAVPAPALPAASGNGAAPRAAPQQPQPAWEPPRNSLWLRGGCIRDGSPIPAGAYAGAERLCRLMPVVEYYCAGSGDLTLVHDVVWPRWVGVSMQRPMKASVAYAQRCGPITWSCAPDDGAGGAPVAAVEPSEAPPSRPPEVPRWRPHMHRITITSANGAHGCTMLRCERPDCFKVPLTISMVLYHHKQEDPDPHSAHRHRARPEGEPGSAGINISNMMEFDEFVRRVDGAVRAAAAVGGFDGPTATQARWETRARNATVVLAPPSNVSVTLAAASEPPATTWYPIDEALVPVVSKRIAAYLGGA